MDPEHSLVLFGALFALFSSALGQVSVSSSAAASVKYNKGAPQAYISSLSSAKADPKIPVNIVGGPTSQPPATKPVVQSSPVPPSPSPPPPSKPMPAPPGPQQNARNKAAWDYHASDNAYGPQNWQLITPKCNGRRQSPIDIITANVVTEPAPIALASAVADAATAQPMIVKGKLKNNGRAIGFTVDKDATPVKFTYRKSTFTLRQFHFHFGCEDEMGSEHSMNGQRFPGEIHFVFTNDQYGDVKQALAQNDGLAALAFFMQYDESAHNKALQRITDNVQALRLPKSVADFSADGISLTNLVPAFAEGLENLKVFVYDGSLPTPPCFESVKWFVYRRKVMVNPTTLETWRNVLQGDYGRMCGNYRPVQKLNARKISSLTPSGPVAPPTQTPPASVPTQSALVSAPTAPVSGPTVAPVPSAGIRGSPLQSLEKVGLGPGRTEKAFATLVRDSGKQLGETHLPADARQEMHAEPVDNSKQKSEGLKAQTLGVPIQGLNPAFAKIPAAKDNNAIPENKKGVEIIQTNGFKSIDAGLNNIGAKQGKKPSVAPGMKRQSGV